MYSFEKFTYMKLTLTPACPVTTQFYKLSNLSTTDGIFITSTR